MNKDNEITDIINNDGTVFDPPKNPLLDKWEKLRKSNNKCNPILFVKSDGSKLMNYSCVLCHSTNCYYSDMFIVPEEDKEIYEDYINRLNSYMKIHNKGEIK